MTYNYIHFNVLAGKPHLRLPAPLPIMCQGPTNVLKG